MTTVPYMSGFLFGFAVFFIILLLSAVGEEYSRIVSRDGVIETPPVNKGWDDPEAIRCSPPDISWFGDDSDDTGTARIVKMVK